MLGRPLGAPGDAVFQRDVLTAALRLLEAPSGPVLHDYPHEAPAIAAVESEGFACPVNFARAATEGDLASAFEHEIAQLAPWYHEAVRKRGRTIASISGLSPQAAGQFITGVIANTNTPPYRADLDMATALRFACEDIKAYYLQAVNAQPGAAAADGARDWLGHDTTAGKVLLALRDACLASSEPTLQRFGGKSLVPLAIAPRPAEWVYEAKWK